MIFSLSDVPEVDVASVAFRTGGEVIGGTGRGSRGCRPLLAPVVKRSS